MIMSPPHQRSTVACAIFTALIFCLQVSAQSALPTLSTEDEIRSDLMLAPCESKQRAEAVIKLFQKMGASDSEITSEEIKGVRNILITKAGNENETIIVGAHYDKTAAGCGAIDNWTGIVIIAHLYRVLRTANTHKNYLFVAFDKEESGLIGSATMARSIPKENRSSYCAMVNVDSFGLAQPFALENASSAKLMALAKTSAASLQLPFYTARIDAGTSDSGSFIAGKIPGITLSGLSQDWQKVLHSRQDQAAKVNPGSVYLGYRLALLMWSQIDAQPCAAFR